MTVVTVTVAAIAVVELVMVVVVVVLLATLFVVVVIVVDIIVVVNLGHVIEFFLNKCEVTVMVVVAVTVDNDLVRWASNVTLVANDVVNLAIFALLHDWLVVVTEVDLMRIVVFIN